MNPEEHPTSNIQRRTSNGSAGPRSFRRSMFDVELSMFSLGSGGSTREIFVGRDLSERKFRALNHLNRGKTSKVQHRTSNAEMSEDPRCHSMFGVGCSMLDVPPGSFAVKPADHFRASGVTFSVTRRPPRSTAMSTG